MESIILPSNQPTARFYRGGERISRFRGEPSSASNTPEDWVGSTTSVRGQAPTGMTRLADGELLADAVARNPNRWLGERHVERFGVDTMLLVKLLDAGQRLPVHAHPDRSFASRHVLGAHGKAEAWYILTPGLVHLGLVRDVSDDELRMLVATQDSAGLLALMHAVTVAAGDSVFVPHGALHAIGDGILLAEVQEPEDLSILLEWTGFDLDGERDGHLGLGFGVALSAVETRGRSTAEIEGLVRRSVAQGPALPGGAEQFFRLDRVDVRHDFAAGFAIVIALEEAVLTLASGARRLAAGSTVLVPFAAGPFRIEGAALVARPPKS
ncbi:MAG TPA: class I mannose-6-phosphate isomerase [Naasia sp.]